VFLRVGFTQQAVETKKHKKMVFVLSQPDAGIATSIFTIA
jgi:hypothetical protein